MKTSNEPDLVTEVEELLAQYRESGFRKTGMTKQPADLLRRLVEDNKRLRQFGCDHCTCTCNHCAPCGEKLP